MFLHHEIFNLALSLATAKLKALKIYLNIVHLSYTLYHMTLFKTINTLQRDYIV